jgi:hypothetical protein
MSFCRQDYSDFNGLNSVNDALQSDSSKDYYELVNCPEEAESQPSKLYKMYHNTLIT